MPTFCPHSPNPLGCSRPHSPHCTWLCEKFLSPPPRRFQWGRSSCQPIQRAARWHSTALIKWKWKIIDPFCDFRRCEYSPIDGRTIATGRFPASFSSMLSARAFVKVYVFGRLPISDGVNCNLFGINIKSTSMSESPAESLMYLVQKIFR